MFLKLRCTASRFIFLFSKISDISTSLIQFILLTRRNNFAQTVYRQIRYLNNITPVDQKKIISYDFVSSNFLFLKFYIKRACLEQKLQQVVYIANRSIGTWLYTKLMTFSTIPGREEPNLVFFVIII